MRDEVEDGLWRRELGLGPRTGHALPASARLVRSLKPERLGMEPHMSTVYSLSWSADGQLLISAGEDAVYKIWNVDSRTCQTVHSGHQAGISCARFLPDCGNCKLVSCGLDRQVRVWDLQKGAVRPFPKQRGGVRCVAALSADVVLSASDDGRVRRLDVREPGPARGASQAVVDEYNNRVLLVEQKQEPFLASATSSGAPVGVNCLTLDPLALHTFATGGGDTLVRVYDLRMLRRPGADTHHAGGPAWTHCYVPTHLTQPRYLGGLHSSPWLRRPSYHVTGLSYSHTGNRLVASYSNEHVYTFNCKQHALTDDGLQAAVNVHPVSARYATPYVGALGRRRGYWPEATDDTYEPDPPLVPPTRNTRLATRYSARAANAAAADPAQPQGAGGSGGGQQQAAPAAGESDAGSGWRQRFLRRAGGGTSAAHGSAAAAGSGSQGAASGAAAGPSGSGADAGPDARQQRLPEELQRRSQESREERQRRQQEANERFAALLGLPPLPPMPPPPASLMDALTRPRRNAPDTAGSQGRQAAPAQPPQRPRDYTLSRPGASSSHGQPSTGGSDDSAAGPPGIPPSLWPPPLTLPPWMSGGGAGGGHPVGQGHPGGTSGSQLQQAPQRASRPGAQPTRQEPDAGPPTSLPHAPSQYTRLNRVVGSSTNVAGPSAVPNPAGRQQLAGDSSGQPARRQSEPGSNGAGSAAGGLLSRLLPARLRSSSGGGAADEPPAKRQRVGEGAGASTSTHAGGGGEAGQSSGARSGGLGGPLAVARSAAQVVGQWAASLFGSPSTPQSSPPTGSNAAGHGQAPSAQAVPAGTSAPAPHGDAVQSSAAHGSGQPGPSTASGSGSARRQGMDLPAPSEDEQWRQLFGAGFSGGSGRLGPSAQPAQPQPSAPQGAPAGVLGGLTGLPPDVDMEGDSDDDDDHVALDGPPPQALAAAVAMAAASFMQHTFDMLEAAHDVGGDDTGEGEQPAGDPAGDPAGSMMPRRPRRTRQAPQRAEARDHPPAAASLRSDPTGPIQQDVHMSYESLALEQSAPPQPAEQTSQPAQQASQSEQGQQLAQPLSQPVQQAAEQQSQRPSQPPQPQRRVTRAAARQSGVLLPTAAGSGNAGTKAGGSSCEGMAPSASTGAGAGVCGRKRRAVHSADSTGEPASEGGATGSAASAEPSSQPAVEVAMPGGEQAAGTGQPAARRGRRSSRLAGRVGETDPTSQPARSGQLATGAEGSRRPGRLLDLAATAAAVATASQANAPAAAPLSDPVSDQQPDTPLLFGLPVPVLGNDAMSAERPAAGTRQGRQRRVAFLGYPDPDPWRPPSSDDDDDDNNDDEGGDGRGGGTGGFGLGRDLSDDFDEFLSAFPFIDPTFGTRAEERRQRRQPSAAAAAQAVDKGYELCFTGRLNKSGRQGVCWMGPHSEYVVSGSDLGYLHVWDSGSGQLVAMLRDNAVGPVTAMQAHPRDICIAAASGSEDSNIVKLWQPSGDPLTGLQISAQEEQIGAQEKEELIGCTFLIACFTTRADRDGSRERWQSRSVPGSDSGLRSQFEELDPRVALGGGRAMGARDPFNPPGSVLLAGLLAGLGPPSPIFDRQGRARPGNDHDGMPALDGGRGEGRPGAGTGRAAAARPDQSAQQQAAQGQGPGTGGGQGAPAGGRRSMLFPRMLGPLLGGRPPAGNTSRSAGASGSDSQPTVAGPSGTQPAVRAVGGQEAGGELGWTGGRRSSRRRPATLADTAAVAAGAAAGPSGSSGIAATALAFGSGSHAGDAGAGPSAHNAGMADAGGDRGDGVSDGLDLTITGEPWGQGAGGAQADVFHEGGQEDDEADEGGADGEVGQMVNCPLM